MPPITPATIGTVGTVLEGASVEVADAVSVSLETVEGGCNFQLRPNSQNTRNLQVRLLQWNQLLS